MSPGMNPAINPAMSPLKLCSLLIGISAASCTTAKAADFYEGKTVTIVVGYTAGGTYDQQARFYAREFPRFLPGKPTIIVQNMPGAGSLIAAGYLAGIASRDGLTLGIVGGGAVWEPLLGSRQTKYDPRNFNWLGGFSRDNITCLVWHDSPVQNLADATKQEVVVGATGPGSRTMSFPKALNDIVGTKFKLVMGYPGGNEITLALEKGEVQGYCGWALGSMRQRAREWLDQKKVRFLAQFATVADPELKGVPLATDLPKTDEGKRVMEFLTSDATLAWTLLAPPGVPADRVTSLRKAYLAMLADPEAQADANKAGLLIDPVSGQELQDLVASLAATPPETLKAIRRINGE
jgi:tripartite-type tricarboxylate transporter receptor subunit TctC